MKKGENKMNIPVFPKGARVVFAGDSITNGSHNNGHPWYEPLMTKFKNKNVIYAKEDTIYIDLAPVSHFL